LDVGQRASATAGPHCNIQVTCHLDSYKIYNVFNGLNFEVGTWPLAPPLISSRPPNN
jgi:hypothetical protein